MDNERKTLTFDQLPQAVGELLDKVDHIIARLGELKGADGASSGDDKMMTLDEASKFIGKARSTLYSLTSDNRIPHRKCCNKLYFFKKELLEWIKNGGIYDSSGMPVDMSQAAFEAHAMELRNQKRNKPAAFKDRKGDRKGGGHGE